MAVSFVKCFSMKTASRDGYSSAIFEPDTVSDSEEEQQEEERNDPNHLACDRDVAFNTFESAGFDGCVYKPETDGPFSRITPSMWPVDMIATFSQPEDSHPPFRFDEYGFVIDDVTENDPQSKETDPRQASMNELHLRTKWLAFLELTYNTEARPRMKWSDVERQLKRCRPLEELIEMGLPNSMRAQLWLRFTRGLTLSANHKYLYSEMVEKSKIEMACDVQVTHVLPNNVCFMNSQSVGSTRLARVLRVLKWLQRTGKCIESQESVNVPLIAAYLLLICEEEEVFWLILAIAKELRNLDHQSILKSCIAKACPKVDQLLKQNDIEISLITVSWFATLFATFFTDVSLLFRFWDFYFYYGPEVLFQLTIGVIESKNVALNEVGKDSAALFNQLEDLSSQVCDWQQLKKCWELGRQLIPFLPQANRRFSDLSASSDLATSSKSNRDLHDLRNKNILQTSILVELHEAIVAVGQHFETYDPQFKADFSLDLSEKPSEMAVGKHSPIKQTRLAKALVDFQRNDPDELGFKKHDIITVVSERDEHCWIGELNGVTGWFPAQFVLPLDQAHDYAVAGDDRMVMFINDLVRGRLCQVLKQVLSHGLKKGNFLVVHPWTVIEAVAIACVEADFNSVYAKLVLTKTYRLDDLTRVLTPSEILYKNITLIKQTHAEQPMDIRLRSLVCLSLNQRMLHDFLTVVCVTQPDLLEKHYHEWAYIRSPVWRLIRAELKLLTQFSFNLNPYAELQVASASPVSKDGVRDMLVKHHLFSWDV